MSHFLGWYADLWTAYGHNFASLALLVVGTLAAVAAALLVVGLLVAAVVTALSGKARNAAVAERAAEIRARKAAERA